MTRCPWHDDKTPSLAAYRKQRRCWCFACSKGRDALDVTGLFLDRGTREAVRYRADRLRLDRTRPSPEEDEFEAWLLGRSR